MSQIQMDDIAKYFGRIQDLLLENEELRNQLSNSEAKVRAYRHEMKEMQDSMLNRDGALRKQRDEIHVLYHKISALLGDERKPKNYTKLGDAQKRIALQEILDELEPTDIRFKDPNGRPNTQKWTLVKYGNKPWIDPVSSYPEQALAFC